MQPNGRSVELPSAENHGFAGSDRGGQRAAAARRVWPSAGMPHAISPPSWRRIGRPRSAASARFGERRPIAKQAEIEVAPNAFANLAENLSEAWNAPGVTTRARQQLLRALIVDIIVDVDENACDVVLTVHWRGGQH